MTAATATSLDPSVSEAGISADSASEPLNITILNEPAREYRRYYETPNRIRVVMTQNLAMWSYIIHVETLPPKPPKPPKDFPVAKVLPRSTVGRIWTRLLTR